MNKLHTAVCLCAFLLCSFAAQAQTGKESLKSLYSITTPYEKARKKLVDQAYDKLGKITTAQERIGMSLLYALGNADNDDPEIKGSEIAELEANEASIALYIGFSQLSQLDQSSDEYYYKQLLIQLGQDPDGPKNRFAEWYLTERERVEKLKTATDKQRNLLRHPPEGSLLKLQKNVASQFRSWARKGEFESSNDHQTRLRLHAAETFDSICQAAAAATCLESLVLEAGNYDADQAQLTLTLRHGQDAQLNITHALPPAQAQQLVPAMRKGLSNPEKDSVLRIGLVNGFLYPSQAPLLIKYERVRFPLNLDIMPQLTLSYDALSIDDELLDACMKGHTYNGQTAEELLQQRENNNPHFKQWGKFFDTRKEYREQVKKYGTGKEFETQTLYNSLHAGRFDGSYSNFKTAYNKGGMEEVELILALKDTLEIYAQQYGYRKHLFWSQYMEGGLAGVEQNLQAAKTQHIQQEQARIALEQEREAERQRLQQKREAEELRQEKERQEMIRQREKIERQSKFWTTIVIIGGIIGGLSYYLLPYLKD